MDKFIVYIDDADYAGSHLQAVMSSGASVHWVLVACPPRLSRHAGKWINQSARDSWRKRWADTLFAQVKPTLERPGDKVQTLVAKGNLLAFTQELRRTHGSAPVLDARRPKFGEALEAVAPGQQVSNDSRWQLPGAVAGMGAMLVLAAE